ncbi:ER ubiquitin family protein [Schizosaccharomyces osmophilus]|uniref:ER ubiquitin family protein n=1 Tax=Schizosaccharomyces osmophilus TaxID=2545709 RepID=A0AAE9WAE3_9SCHI|nr:ER ubiquitin family protein [Schizosaccharomyces osmophilus]WBW71781.1 ER ubiquitin family protein [Schizosaccharomyces osmophilus]
MTEMSEYKIRVTTVDQKVGIFQVARDKTVLDLKNIIAPTFEAPVDRLKLIYAGRVLRNETILFTILNDVTDLVTFHLVISIISSLPLSSSAPTEQSFSQLAPFPRQQEAHPPSSSSLSVQPSRTITSLNPEELSQRERAQHLFSNYQRVGRTAGIHGMFPNMIQRIESSGLVPSAPSMPQTQDSIPNNLPSPNESSMNPFIQLLSSQRQIPIPNPTTTTTTSVTSVPDRNVTMVVASSVQGRNGTPHTSPIPNGISTLPFGQNNGGNSPQIPANHASPSPESNTQRLPTVDNLLHTDHLHRPSFVGNFSSPPVSSNPQRLPNELPGRFSVNSHPHAGSLNLPFTGGNLTSTGGFTTDAPQLLPIYYQTVFYNGSYYLQQMPSTNTFSPLPFHPVGSGLPPVISPYGIMQNQQTGECAYLLSPSSERSSLQVQPMTFQNLRRFQLFTSSVLSPFTHTFENIRRHFRLFIRLALFCALATYNDSLPHTMLLTSIMAFVFLLQAGALSPIINENRTLQTALEYVRNVQNEYRQRRSGSNPEVIEVANAPPSENQENVTSETQRRRTDTEYTRLQRFLRSVRGTMIAFASSFVPRS